MVWVVCGGKNLGCPQLPQFLGAGREARVAAHSIDSFSERASVVDFCRGQALVGGLEKKNTRGLGETWERSSGGGQNVLFCFLCVLWVKGDGRRADNPRVWKKDAERT